MEDKQPTASMYASMEELHIAKAKYYQAKYEEMKKEWCALRWALERIANSRCDDPSCKECSHEHDIAEQALAREGQSALMRLLGDFRRY